MSIREPAVAGLFYPDRPEVLQRTVDDFLSQAAGPADTGVAATRAVIAPHAGHVYSGSTAAVAYRHLDLDGVRRVAVLGPTHRVAVRGIALPESLTWRTPLGDLDVDVDDLAGLDALVTSDRVHELEHSLEVHLPFLQRLAPGAAIAPLAVGHVPTAPVADAIARLLADEHTVVVISSDLSHYLPQDQARRVDRATLRRITALDGEIGHDQACGATPVNGLMEHARRTGAGLRELASCTSGDTAGDPHRVVGYAALALTGARA